jgi:hypothetical protein
MNGRKGFHFIIHRSYFIIQLSALLCAISASLR